MKKFKNTFSWTHSDIFVSETMEGEYGVFAKNNIKKDESIAVFGGYVFSIAEESELPASISDNAVQISEDLVLGIKCEADIEIACYFNHSCNPNAGFGGQILLRAMRNIMKGEQITFDYGMVLFRSPKGIDYEFKCLCAEKDCRKIVTNQDWKIQSLQEKYDGYFQYYLNEKIKYQKK